MNCLEGGGIITYWLSIFYGLGEGNTKIWKCIYFQINRQRELLFFFVLYKSRNNFFLNIWINFDILIFALGSSSLSTISPSTREAVDPIAELLSQLSGVRRAQGSTSSSLQQLQMELQLRQQAPGHRQTLDRLARRAPGASSAGPVHPAVGQPSSVQGSQVAAATGQPPYQSNQKDRKGETGFLLSALESGESGTRDGTGENAKQRIFIQDLLLAALNLEEPEQEDEESWFFLF